MHAALFQRVQAPGSWAVRRPLRCAAQAERPVEGEHWPSRPLYVPNRIDDPNYVRTLAIAVERACSKSLLMDGSPSKQGHREGCVHTRVHSLSYLGVPLHCCRWAPQLPACLFSPPVPRSCSCRCASLTPHCETANSPPAAHSQGSAQACACACAMLVPACTGSAHSRRCKLSLAATRALPPSLSILQQGKVVYC